MHSFFRPHFDEINYHKYCLPLIEKYLTFEKVFLKISWYNIKLKKSYRINNKIFLFFKNRFMYRTSYIFYHNKNDIKIFFVLLFKI